MRERKRRERERDEREKEKMMREKEKMMREKEGAKREKEKMMREKMMREKEKRMKEKVMREMSSLWVPRLAVWWVQLVKEKPQRKYYDRSRAALRSSFEGDRSSRFETKKQGPVEGE